MGFEIVGNTFTGSIQKIKKKSVGFSGFDRIVFVFIFLVINTRNLHLIL
jgi:hypothetical protein